MGFETSVVVTIFLVSAILIATISYSTISSSNDLLSSSLDEHYSLLSKKLQTDVEIVESNAVFHNSTYQLSLEVLNTGSETLRSDKLDIYVSFNFKCHSHMDPRNFSGLEHLRSIRFWRPQIKSGD